MEELSIKVNIAGRTYPLTIKRSEEETVRKAAKMLNDNMAHLEANYAVRDKQDLLAMTALQYAQEVMDGKVGTVDDSAVVELLEELDNKLGDHLA